MNLNELLDRCFKDIISFLKFYKDLPAAMILYIFACIAILLSCWLTFDREAESGASILIGMSIFLLLITISSVRSVSDVTNTLVKDNSRVDTYNKVTTWLSFVCNYLWFFSRILVYAVITWIIIEALELILNIHVHKARSTLMGVNISVISSPWFHAVCFPMTIFKYFMVFVEWCTSWFGKCDIDVGTGNNASLAVLKDQIFNPNLLYVFDIATNRNVQWMHGLAFIIGLVVALGYGLFVAFKIEDDESLRDYFTKGIFINAIVVTLTYGTAFFILKPPSWFASLIFPDKNGTSVSTS